MQALREHREGKKDELECAYLEHQWMSVNDIAAKVYSTSSSMGFSSTGQPSYSGPQEVIAVDPELIRPAAVILPPEDPTVPTQPPEQPPAAEPSSPLDAWGSSKGYMFEW